MKRSSHLQDFSQLWCLLCRLGKGGGEGGGGGGAGGGEEGGVVYVDRCVAGVIGEMSEDRKAAVRKVCSP